MKEILIVIHGLGCGGAEKSLISFLKTLNNKEWNIDLLVMNPNGLFMNDIPEYVHNIKNLYEVENYLTPLKNRRKKICGIRDFINQLKWHTMYPFYSKSDLKYDEIRWKIWGKNLPKLKKHYDLAVSYMDGATNYYVIDKVDANKKILWIHNEFEKIGYNNEFEQLYFEKADHIVTISQACVDSFLAALPKNKNKISVLENISSPTSINIMASEAINDEYFKSKKKKILSIGRLNVQKGFDIAIDAARILNENGIDFEWYILGEGELRSSLQEKINSLGLDKVVFLPGIRSNPYPYIKECDVFVQSSRFEGKSIVLDEAKILCKPIVVTNYATVINSINNGVNGMIVNIDPNSIAEGVKKLLYDDDYRLRLVRQLSSENNGNEKEIEKYIDLFEKTMEGAN